ncbi:hypothetical protein ASG31_05790 [Chryseobacterium sp. Leaf404]|uniref:hypothetical protein n=1 Tax=unclassified Chryseobacterium TaxID=2593645 RepID=UPI0007001EBA|nr:MULTISPECIES: hypothetical protein [unclassified Chryseobacterium]KQT18240.1 hypothetical protein ASG31_05790 [Chryseobacterium sp. Leaf404]
MLIKNLTSIVISLLLVGCEKKNTTKLKEKEKQHNDGVPPKNKKVSTNNSCNIKNALKIIYELPEVQKESTFVDSISSGKKRLSFMTDSLEIDNKSYYMVKTGFNGELHWETYTTFFIDKDNCKEILVDEVISGDAIPLDQWSKIKN